jgi:putative ABC transport system substrate-binding protein
MLTRRHALIAGLGLLAAPHVRAQAQPRLLAITSFGEHPALGETVEGIRDSMRERGYVQGQQVNITFTHVNWERNLIPQMLARVAAQRPAALVTITTPVAQASVRAVTDASIPIVFSAIQDPVVAGLIPEWGKPTERMTGASNLADMDGTLRFIKQLLPNLRRLGVPFNPGDDADNALRERLVRLAPQHGVELVLVGVDNANDLPQRMQTFAGRADAIFVIPSNLFQPATAQIAAIARRINLPAFNGLSAPVLRHEMLGSYAVDFYRVGVTTAGLVERIFKGERVIDIAPTRPGPDDHKVVVSGKEMERLRLQLPAALRECNCVVS